jgi:hypothetical protein
VTAGIHWFFRLAAALALIAGFLLFPLAAETNRFFSWTIEPPLTAAFLGAAYWAACVLLGWAAVQRSWVRARVAVPPVLAIAVLLLITTLAHLDKFDLDSVFGWFWLVVYVGVVPLLILLCVRETGRPAPEVASGPPVPLALRALLSLQAAAMLALGLALMIGAEDVTLWPWALTPLTARAIGAFLVGFGVAAAVAVRVDDLRLLHGAALAYATLGALELLAAAIFSEDLEGGLGTAVYVGFVVTVLAAGLYGSIAGRAGSEPSGARPRAARASAGSR